MMKRISDKLEAMINLQIGREEDSSRLYRAMSLFLDDMGWKYGAQLWMKYSEEEMTHAKRFWNYLLDRDALPQVVQLSAQKPTLTCVTDVIAQTYPHEIQVSKWINEIALAALAEKDLTTYQMLQWFINEQIEEEAHSKYWVDRLAIIQKTNSPLIMLEHDFKKALKG